MKTAASTGGIGDIVYSIPVMRKLGVNKIFIKQNFYPEPYGDMCSSMSRLLSTQYIEAIPTLGGLPFFEYESGLKFDYDLDRFRYHGTRGRMHIIKSMSLACRVGFQDWNRPFIQNIPVSCGGYNVVHLTERWREGSVVRWENVLQRIPKPVYFAGLPQDYKIFCERYGKIEWEQTIDILDLALLIADADALYCNQGVALTLAQGLGKQYYCDFKPTKTNTRFYTSNEHCL